LQQASVERILTAEHLHVRVQPKPTTTTSAS
jgi:hypothetical protein